MNRLQPHMPSIHAGPVCMCAVMLLASCGGGGEPAPLPTETQRVAAATATAQSAVNACATIQPFYWEVGDQTTALASGSVGRPTYTSNTSVNIASASKWLYGAYVVQRRGGSLTPDDIKYLTFRSGYTSFSICLSGNTVAQCAQRANNGDYNAVDDGRFAYGGGHMQQHAASQMGLGALDNAGLATELRNQLGTDIGMTYSQPQPAGGVISTAGDYARFLRKLIAGNLRLGASLGAEAVCTNPTTCASAVSTPVPLNESWHYALGHWVEDDPALGDGAFSSAGAFGFYPWIDAGKSRYGIVAREASAGAGTDSALCGRLIRKAWFTGTTQ